MSSMVGRYVTVTVILAFFHSAIGYADASDGMQKQISMTADGWKPIIGSVHPHPTHYHEEIKYYQNPILKETVRAETLPTTTPLTTSINTVRPEKITRESVPISVNIFNHGSTKGKIPPHTKQSPQYFVLPRHGSHGPHIPLNAVTQGRPGQHGILKKVPMKGHHAGNKWMIKKPIIGQFVSSQSSRNEVYVPAPSTGYSYLSQGKNVRTRESSGLGNVGHKLFSIKQPHSHLEYSSHFPPKNLFHHNSQVQHIFFQKQQTNEIIPPYQIDAPQNLLPPPILKNFEKTQLRHVNTHSNPEIQIPNDKIILGHNPLGPNDLILQLPSYEQSLFDFGKQKHTNPSGIQITQEKLKTLPNNIPPKFNVQSMKEFDENYHSFQKPMTEYPKSPTYEVTENKWEENTPAPNKFHKPNKHVQPVELNFPQFLPTPYQPDITLSTSPTQEEVSTIFGHLSNNVKQFPDSYSHDPYLFDVKEVSTHYPILGTPGIISTTKEVLEGATGKPVTKATTEEIPTTTELSKSEIDKPVKIHSNSRRRRPTTRYTTPTQQSTEDITENDNTSISSYSTDEVETERPYRSRRPIRIKPTLTNSEEELEDVPQFNRLRDRHRKRPHQGDLRKKQHKKRVRPNKIDFMEEFTPKTNKVIFKEEDLTVLPIVQHFTTQSVRDFEKDHSESTFSSEVESEIVSNDGSNTREPTFNYSDEQTSLEIETHKQNNDGDSHYRKNSGYIHAVTTTVYEKDNRKEEDTISPNLVNLENYAENEATTKFNEQFKPQYDANMTQSSVSSSVSNLSEYEIESTTTGNSEVNSYVFDKTDNSKTTTSEPTTTVLPSSSTKSHRRRPIKHNPSNRPRFSVKDYRQRLSQYSTTTTSIEPTKSSTENVRLRFPTRLRRPLSTTSTTTEASDEITRAKFTPKEPRHGQSHSVNNELIKEKNVKAVNTRLRPFGRTKTTTEQPSTVSLKISIKPNLFSNRRRPLPISLKSRIMNRNNTKMEHLEINENEVTTIPNNLSGSSSLLRGNTMSPTEDKLENFAESDEPDSTPSSDILKNDAFLYSQRVSDLTSSMKNTYDGFKTIPTSSRRIPNYYTLSTEDPILPIEAFFSNINDKEKDALN